MALPKTVEYKSGVEIPDGANTAILVGLTHIGIQKREWNGEISYKDMMLVQVELPDVPFGDTTAKLSKLETTALGTKSNLNKLFTAIMDGKSPEHVDLSNFLGGKLQVNVKKSAKGNSVIDGYTQLHPSVKKATPPPQHPLVLVDDVENITAEQLAALPEFVRKMINERGQGDNPVSRDVDY